MNKNKWLIVFGANSDIAIAISKKFASVGYNLLLASRNLKNTKKLASNLQIRYSVETKTIKFEAEKFNNHSKVIESLNIEPSVVVFAHGVMHDQKKSEQDFELIHDMVKVNYLSIVNLLELFLNKFSSHKQVSFVILGSVAGDRGKASNYIYGSTKSALETYIEGLWHRLYGTKMRLLLVKPGFVDTKMTEKFDLPKTLTCKPYEVAEQVYKAHLKNKDLIYVKRIWKIIMFLIRLMPKSIFNRTSL